MSSELNEKFRTWGYGLRNSDREVFAELFDETYDALHRYATYFTRDGDAAADILQDVYLKLWNVRDTIDPEKSLRAFMYQMVRNYSLNHQRQVKRHRSEEIDAEHPSVSFDTMNEEKLDAADLGERIHRWIDDMPTRRREAFMLSRYEGLSHDEIAAMMDLAPKTVNNHIVLALQHIREKLSDYRERSSDRDD
jgi:RNA polymerase sigma-70 factor (ECF subfamily)